MKYKTLFHREQCGMEISSAHHADLFLTLHNLHNFGVDLNDILAKRKNNMNKLVEIVIHWSIRKIEFHTDIKKM